MTDEDYQGKWCEGLVRCRVCGYSCVAVAPWPEPGLCDLECSNCSCIAMDEAEEDETVDLEPRP